MSSNVAGSAQHADPLSAFFVTPWSWIAHAALWATGMLLVNSILSVIRLGGPAAALAIVGAGVTACVLSSEQRDVGLAQAARFALVDAVFVGLVAGLLFPLVFLALRVAGWSWGRDADPIRLSATVAIFVAQFYAFLWGAAALRRQRRPWRYAPVAAACVAGLALGWSVWQQAAEHLRGREEVARKQAAYERESGKKADSVKSEIELSLHGLYGRPEDLLIDRQGRLLVVGDFSFYAGHEVGGFVRINADGSLDADMSREALGRMIPAGAGRIRLLEDGAILIDALQTPTESLSPLVLRTLRLGSGLDERPAVAVGAWSPNAYDRRLDPFDAQTDGRILVGRYGLIEQGTQPACVRRFMRDGALDLAFATAVGDTLDSRSAHPAHHCAVTEVLALPDGKILVRLSRRDDQGVWHEELLRRLQANGTLDRSFAPDLAGVHRLALGTNGELIVTTLATTGKSSVFSLLRLRDDGTPDPSFSVAPAFFAHVDALAVQGDGKLLVGGRRSGDALDLGLFRLLPDGRLDAAFGENGRVAVNGFIHRIVLGLEGEIYLLGDFLDVGSESNRLPRYRIARLRPDGTPDQRFDPR